MIPHHLLEKTNSGRGDECRLLLTPAHRMLLMLCVIMLCWLVCSVLNGLILIKFGHTTRVMRIASVLQSVFQIILPSLITALMVSRRPARFLEIDRGASPIVILFGVLLLFVSIPALNSIIHWNQSLHLPDFMSDIEQWMRRAEDRAADSIKLLQGGSSIGDLIMNILIIGILAGLGEELLFRGTIQRMLSTAGMNPHLSIWTVAILFSAIHLQFYGFVPRMLLGALFGYLLYWSGSLWLPVIVHASNNIIYVIASWLALRAHQAEPPIDREPSVAMVIVSVIITAFVLRRIYLICRRRKQNIEDNQ